MKLTNPIGWCDETTNMVTGCSRVSPGCVNCYAEVGTRARVLRAQGIETWGPKGIRHPVAEFAKKIRRLNKLCICKECCTTYPHERRFGPGNICNGYPYGPNYQQCYGELRPIRLFADSNSDWLDEQWPLETLAGFLKEIHDAPNVSALLLTKRVGSFWKRLSHLIEYHPEVECARRWIIDHDPLPNLWFGVSVEDQQRAEERIPLLMQIPARVRFLSVEPLLEEVNLWKCFPVFSADEGTQSFDTSTLHWAIIGGESGKDRRDCGVKAITNAADQCISAGIPVYVKQDSAFHSGQRGRIQDRIWARKEFPKV